jgi:hypothetical protein
LRCQSLHIIGALRLGYAIVRAELAFTVLFGAAPIPPNADINRSASPGVPSHTASALSVMRCLAASSSGAGRRAKTSQRTATPLSINTASTNTLIINALGNQATAGSGWTLIDSGSSNYLALEYQIVSSAGTYSGTWGSGTGSGDSGFAVAIVAASGGGGGAALASIAIPRKMFLKPKRPFMLR